MRCGYFAGESWNGATPTTFRSSARVGAKRERLPWEPIQNPPTPTALWQSGGLRVRTQWAGRNSFGVWVVLLSFPGLKGSSRAEKSFSRVTPLDREREFFNSLLITVLLWSLVSWAEVR